MNKYNRYFSFISLLALFFIVLWGINRSDVKQVLNKQGECRLENNQCTLNIDSKTISLIFEQTPVPEEEILVNFDIAEGLNIKSAHVEGINMYMGKTPVLFENSENNGVFFLGSCNLDTMQWKMIVEFELSNTQELAEQGTEFKPEEGSAVIYFETKR